MPFKLCENEVMAGCDEKELLLGMDVTAGEEHPATVKPSLAKPSSDEGARHETIHCPYMSWWPACVAASAK